MTPQVVHTLIANGKDTRHQFKAVLRPLPSPGHTEKAESKAESLETRVLHALHTPPTAPLLADVRPFIDTTAVGNTSLSKAWA